MLKLKDCSRVIFTSLLQPPLGAVMLRSTPTCGVLIQSKHPFIHQMWGCVGRPGSDKFGHTRLAKEAYITTIIWRESGRALPAHVGSSEHTDGKRNLHVICAAPPRSRVLFHASCNSQSCWTTRCHHVTDVTTLGQSCPSLRRLLRTCDSACHSSWSRSGVNQATVLRTDCILIVSCVI